MTAWRVTLNVSISPVSKLLGGSAIVRAVAAEGVADASLFAPGFEFNLTAVDRYWTCGQLVYLWAAEGTVLPLKSCLIPHNPVPQRACRNLRRAP
jgi:hypothetical protein